jgi:hypothetical protein
MRRRFPNQQWGLRGLGQTYNTVSTSAGDYQVTSDGTIFDPNGNIVSAIPGYAPISGPLLPSQAPTYMPVSPSGSVSTTTSSLASLFPGLQGNTTIAGVSVPSWVVPVALIASAFVLYKAFTK